ncbi:MAG: hypothetical protein AB9861_08650 [Methanosarcina sp.]|jgi:hypothetical protein
MNLLNFCAGVKSSEIVYPEPKSDIIQFHRFKFDFLLFGYVLKTLSENIFIFEKILRDAGQKPPGNGFCSALRGQNIFKKVDYKNLLSVWQLFRFLILY